MVLYFLVWEYVSTLSCSAFRSVRGRLAAGSLPVSALIVLTCQIASPRKIPHSPGSRKEESRDTLLLRISVGLNGLEPHKRRKLRIACRIVCSKNMYAEARRNVDCRVLRWFRRVDAGADDPRLAHMHASATGPRRPWSARSLIVWILEAQLQCPAFMAQPAFSMQQRRFPMPPAVYCKPHVVKWRCGRDVIWMPSHKTRRASQVSRDRSGSALKVTFSLGGALSTVLRSSLPP